MDTSHFKTLVKRTLLKPAVFYNTQFAYISRLEMGFARGTLNVATRQIDEARPSTWEFSAFSQNGEDGIIDFLLARVSSPNRYFVEIGASDGVENNSSYLAFAKKYDGVMVEGNSYKSGNAERFLQPLNWSVKYLNLFIEPETVNDLLSECLYLDPDFFSLDIDSNDYFVAKALLEAGLRPKVVCLEYNSAFGPDASVSIAYTRGIDYLTFHSSQVYYGVSVEGWRSLLGSYGYEFVTVDTRGVNAFFVDPKAVELPSKITPVSFVENATQLRRHRGGWESQSALIRDLPTVEIAKS